MENIGGVVTEAGPHIQITVIDGKIIVEVDGGEKNWASVEMTGHESRLLRNSLARAEHRVTS